MVAISPEVLADPIGVVVDLVAGYEPTLDRESIHAAVMGVVGGRAMRRQLAQAVRDRPAVLVDGRSPAPRAVGALLLALRAAGAEGISPPLCAGCGRAISSMQRRGEDWYCSPCFTRPQPCAGCGQQRHVTFRDRQGQPRCSRCPDHDGRDPRQVLVEVIASVDPGLTTDAIIAAITATVVKPAHAQKLAWAIEDAPELLTGDGAKATFPMVLRLVDALRDAGATGIQRPACPRCRRVVALSKQRDGLRICRTCAAKANSVPCARCRTVREPATRDEYGQPLCANCLAADPANLEECVRCRRRQRVNTRTPQGPVCATCIPKKTSVCSGCGRTVPCTLSKTTGQPRCGACARCWAQCSHCGQRAAVRAGTREVPLCASCTVPDPGFWKTCPGCGTSGRLIAGACGRCHLHQRLDELLTDTGGQIRPELRVLHETLACVERPITVLNWLKRPAVASALAEFATGQRPLSHAALDDLPDGKPVEHLRSVLVATAALPARDEQLARIERWVAQTIAARSDPQDKQLLHRYAVWHLLRRLRHRNRGADTTHGQLDALRQRVRAAIGLIDWLHARNLTLATCRQADLDLWLTSHDDASPRFGAGHFVRWAISHNINRSLQFSATRWTGPAHPLDHDERWRQAKRLLHDNTIATDDRAAGLLLLLYAQRPAAISRLTVDDIDLSDSTVKICFGSVPITLPEPLATMVRTLASARGGHAVLGSRGTSPWLFPGGQPGRPVSADRLGQRLRQLGLQPGQARSTALFQLATELPAAVLARTLGIHIKVAVAWQHASAGDWANYAADVSRRHHNR
jgi:integrase